MNTKHFDQLLDKYWEGAATLQEEQALRQYFAQPDLPLAHRQYAPLFAALEAEKTTTLGDDFDDELLAKLTPSLPRHTQRQPRMAYLWRAAAVALLVVGMSGAVRHFTTPKSLTLNDLTAQERLEYEQTKAALLLVSQKLNKGAAYAAKGVAKVHEATDRVRHVE